MSIGLPIPCVSRLADDDMRAAPTALARAAQRARETAARTGTPLIVTQNGELVEEFIPRLPTSDSPGLGKYDAKNRY
jgi:hypothetical protein